MTPKKAKTKRKRPVCLYCGRLMVVNQVCKPCAADIDRKAMHEQLLDRWKEGEKQRLMNDPEYDRPVRIRKVKE